MSKNDVKIIGIKREWQGFETADLILWEVLNRTQKQTDSILPKQKT
jgi:tRNA U34 5-carboxymethylaminomethyl modifying GTPase MnmE/TrmE